jgi:hypothetical protein
MATQALTQDTVAPLDELTAKIRREIDAAQADYESALRHAIRAGELLTEVKARLRHGEWLPWLRDNFPGSERTARLYMQLYKNRHGVADMPSINQALEAIVGPDVPKSEPRVEVVKPKPRTPLSDEEFARCPVRPMHDVGDWPKRRSALVRDAFARSVGRIAEVAAMSATPEDRDAMERDYPAVLHEVQVYVDRVTADPWALVNGTPATVVLSPDYYGGGTCTVEPGKAA